MGSDGTYRKKKQEGAPVNAQETFMKEALNARRPSAAVKREKRSLLARVFDGFWKKERWEIRCCFVPVL